MKVADLSPGTLERLKKWCWDRILRKHEGPDDWARTLAVRDPDFMTINSHEVLLPIPKDQHGNITILRCILSDDGNTLTIFLKDRTYAPTPEEEFFSGGFLAVCDKFPGEDFYVAIVYHNWFMVVNS